MRRAFADTLTRVAGDDSRVVFLTGDLGFQVFEDFATKYAGRYVNVGIAEAQMVCMAAGLALEGFRPTCYSIASFLTGRAFEQIRVSVAYPGLPVVFVGAGGGYTYAASGVTHHAAEDMALLTALPGMTVVAPGDPNEVTQLLPQMYALNGPSYIRIGRFGETTYEAAEPAVLGRARKLRDGSRFVVLSSGDITPGVLAAADRLTADGITPALYQFHTVKPLDTETLDRLAQEFDTFLVAEESLPTGGLFSAVAMWQTTCAKPPHLRRLGPPDALALGNYDRETLRNRLGYDTEGVETACRRLWHCARLKRLAA